MYEPKYFYLLTATSIFHGWEGSYNAWTRSVFGARFQFCLTSLSHFIFAHITNSQDECMI